MDLRDKSFEVFNFKNANGNRNAKLPVEIEDHNIVEFMVIYLIDLMITEWFI